MKNPDIKRKSHPVLIAALFGGLLFAGLTLLMVIIAHGKPDYILGFLGIPSGILIDKAGLYDWFFELHNVDSASNILVVTVNGLIGAFLFSMLAVFWHLLVKVTKKN